MKEASEQLIELLGHPYHPKQIQALLQSFGVKRMTELKLRLLASYREG